jgi:putative SOS response-associated peptidase YedK
MCGRYASTRSDDQLVAVMAAAEVVGESVSPSWNVAPTQSVRVVLERTPRETTDHTPSDTAPVRQLRTARWGLVPSWAKDPKIGNKLINARSETITEKPSFTAAAARRRCIVPADGYFEWEKRDGAKVPHYLHPEGEDEILAMAGLYELWRPRPAEGEEPAQWLWSVTILTTTAADALGHIHDRSPVVLPTGLRDAWLDPTITDHDQVRGILTQVPEPRLIPREVSTAVNNPRNNTPELLHAVSTPPAAPWVGLGWVGLGDDGDHAARRPPP